MSKNKYFTNSKKLSAILMSVFILASKNLFSIRLVVFFSFLFTSKYYKNNRM
jgi:hypothetical protein